MALSSCIDALADGETELAASDLTQLSGLLEGEREELRSRWADIGPLRRREVLIMLVELADGNCDLDFEAVYDTALADPDAGVREQAVGGLWESEDRRTIPKLTSLLRDDPDDHVRAAAALGLGHFAVLAVTDKLVERDVTLVYRSLMQPLGDPDEAMAVRRRALEAVGAFATEEVAGFIRWGFESDEPKLRQSALNAMGRSCDPSWLPTIYDEMGSGDPAMRYEAANAAREIGETESVSHLADMVEDPDVEVALAAVLAVGSIGGARAKKLLRAIAADDEDGAVREAAATALRLTETDEVDLSRFEPSGRLGLSG